MSQPEYSRHQIEYNEALALIPEVEREAIMRKVSTGNVTAIFRGTDGGVWVHIERQGPTSGDYQSGSEVVYNPNID